MPALNFVAIPLRLSSSPAPRNEQEAHDSTKSAEKKNFLTCLLISGDVAHGKLASLSSPLSSTIYLIPAACLSCPQVPDEVPCHGVRRW